MYIENQALETRTSVDWRDLDESWEVDLIMGLL